MDAMEDVVATEPRRYRQLQNICVIWKFMSVWRTASDIIVICYRLRWRRRTDSKSETLLIVGIQSVGKWCLPFFWRLDAVAHKSFYDGKWRNFWFCIRRLYHRRRCLNPWSCRFNVRGAIKRFPGQTLNECDHIQAITIEFSHERIHLMMISVSFGTFERVSRGRADLGHCWTVCAAALLCVKIAFSANGLDQVWNYFVTFGRHCIFFCCRIRWPRAGEACQRYCVRASISRTDTLKNISQRCHYYIVSIFNSDSLTPRATRTFRTHTTNSQANFFVLFFFSFLLFRSFLSLTWTTMRGTIDK